MRFRWMTCLLLVAMSACSWLVDTQTYSVYFAPYSSASDQQARETIRKAAGFAQAHPLTLVVVTGFSAPPDPNLDVGGLSAQRAEEVKKMLVSEGIGANRIRIAAYGIADPKPMPGVAVRRVDISIGQ